MKDNIIALTIGAIVVAVISSLTLWTMESLQSAFLVYLSWASPAIGSFITAITAKSKKLTFAMLLAVPSAFIFGIENYIWQLLGKGSDFPGLKGFTTLVSIELISGIILCGIGGSLGYFITRHKVKTVQSN